MQQVQRDALTSGRKLKTRTRAPGLRLHLRSISHAPSCFFPPSPAPTCGRHYLCCISWQEILFAWAFVQDFFATHTLGGCCIMQQLGGPSRLHSKLQRERSERESETERLFESQRLGAKISPLNYQMCELIES
jgi:hypothetical protein